MKEILELSLAEIAICVAIGIAYIAYGVFSVASLMSNKRTKAE